MDTWLRALPFAGALMLVLLQASVPGSLRAQSPARGGASSTPGASLPVEEFTLQNGMRFLVLERRGAPTVSFVSVVGVGGLNENPGTTGIAHLLEHLLFKGTTSLGTRDVEAERALFAVMDSLHREAVAERGRPRPDTARLADLRARIDALEDEARAYSVPNEYDRILTRAGARGLNATTDNEATTYYVEIPRNRAELWFALESDRILNPVFREFYTERDVVMEERRLRVDTSPDGLLYEAYLAAAFTAHPYGQPVVGYMSDLEVLSRKDVRDYYRRYYGPGNMVVAVVGDVDAEQIRGWAREYFADIPAGQVPPPVLVREPEQRGVRRVEVGFDAGASLRMGWHVPSLRHPDAPALAVLTALLTGGRTSLLHQALVQDERLVTAISSSMGPGILHPRLLTIQATPRSPHTAEQVEARIHALLADFAADPPDERDLAQVRNQLAAGAVRRLQSNFGLALQLASTASALGDWRETFRLTDAMSAVSAEEIQDVTRRYLRPDRVTVAVVRRPEDAS